jgi:hypothetical protein
MKAVKLNLEDRQSWQKFQHVLTSFASDYIDLVAPEQTEFRFEQQTLFLTFALITASPDRERANFFTQNLESFLIRLKLIGVRRVELEFLATGETPLFSGGFDVTYIKPELIQDSQSAIARRPNQAIARTKAPGRQGRTGALARGFNRIKGWLTNPALLQNIQGSGRLAARDPKGFLVAAKDNVGEKFGLALTWVDTFPWEAWFKAKLQWQERRHKRNLIKAIFEDFIFAAILVLLLFWGSEFLSGPTINLAKLPAQHYTDSMDGPKYRCGNAGLTRKNYVCLSKGMSYGEVAGILGGEGRPLAIDTKFGLDSDRINQQIKKDGKFNSEEVAVIVIWSDPNNKMTMNATFKGDKLVAKAMRDLPS